MENIEDIITEVGRPILRPLGFIQSFFLLLILCSPFAWMWFSWTIAWKLFLTGIVGVLIIYFIYKFVRNHIAKNFDDVIKNEHKKVNSQPIKSRFQEKLEDMQRQREQSKLK